MPAVAPSMDIGLADILLPVGSTAPSAAIVTEPVPSELIVAPPRSIVFAATNKVCHLRVLEPKVNTPS